MNQTMFLVILLLAALFLQQLNHSIVCLQVRNVLGIDPVYTMIVGGLLSWLSNLATAIAVAVTVVEVRKRE